MATDGASKACDDVKSAQEKLPPLSDRDFRIYNNMADHMELFVSHARHTPFIMTAN